MLNQAAVALGLCLAGVMTAAAAAPAVDAKAEREAAVKAEQAGDWDAALLHYENIYDSTPTTPEERVELRRKFAELHKKVKPNEDPAKAGIYKVRVYVFRTVAIGPVTNTYNEKQIKDVDKATAAWAGEVWKASLGNCRLVWETVVIDKPLTSFAGFPHPRDCTPYLTDMQPGDADNVTVYALSKGLDRNCRADTWGSCCKGATYAGFNDAGDGSTCGSGEIQVHEWLHAIQMTMEWHHLYPDGLLINPDTYGNCGPNCWRPKEDGEGMYNWYRHMLTTHMTRKMWRELSLNRLPANPWIDKLDLCPKFLVLGPFDGAGKTNSGFDAAFIDEAGAKPSAGQKAGGKVWREVIRGGSFLDLGRCLYPVVRQAAYVAAVVQSPDERAAQVRIGSGAGCKVWHNGKLILTHPDGRGCGLDQDNVNIKLSKGDNLFLMKVVNSGAWDWCDWGANLRVTDAEGKPLPDIQYALPGEKTSAAAPIGAVMPVGDSLTAGYSSDPAVDAGWRAPLYKSLTAAGYSFQFVGTTNVNPGRSLPTKPVDQTWHCGGTVESWRTLAVRDNIGNWLKTLAAGGKTPAFIVMMTGTNDINDNNVPASVGNVSSIIDTVHAQAPKSMLFLAKIVPVFSPDNAWVAAYNAGLVALVSQKRAAGCNVAIVDLNTGFPFATGMTADTVHPNAVGYAWIAQQWHTALATAAPAPVSGALQGQASAGRQVSGN